MSFDEAPASSPGGQDCSADRQIIRDATCTACGCVCDDIDLTVQGKQITEAVRACDLGRSWFLSQKIPAGPACLIQGQPASVAEGIEQAALLLSRARYPLVYGLRDTTTESQRVAAGIADWIGGCLDSTTSVSHGPSGVAFQGVGEVTCSLGEARNRGDLIIFWGTDPETSHPRHLSKYSLYPTGRFVPGGRNDRTCVVIDVQPTKTAAAADVFIQLKRDSDFEAIWILRALAAGIEIDADDCLAQTGQPLSVWQNLMEQFKAAKFAVLFYGMGIALTRGRYLNSEALLALTRDMNRYTRFVCKSNRGHGNVTGADNVITWRTGYPFGVNLARGYPRFNPGEYTAQEILSRKEADAALIVSSDPIANLEPAARDHLLSIPYVSLDPRETPTKRGAAIAFTVATYGINVPGTVYRLDDVPIPLRPAFDSPFPSDLEILQRIETRVKELKAGSNGAG